CQIMSARSEDVYESPDLPAEDPNAKFAKPEKTSPDEEVELIHIDVDSALKKFSGRVLNCENIDFSDSIAKKRRNAYGSSAYVLEIVGKDYGEAETPEQKFNRLTYEMAELGELLKKDESVKTGLLTENSVNQLMDELKAAKIAKTSGTAEVRIIYKFFVNHSLSLRCNYKVAALEGRMKRIETLLGSVGDSSVPLIDTLEDLRFRTDTFNTTFLDGIESRLNTVLNKLDQVETRKKQGENGELETKVDSIYSLMSKWDSSCTNLGSTVKRLQSLRGLHEQASQFSERLSQLVGIKDELEKAASTTRLAMGELQGQTKEEIGALLKQIGTLEARLKK
ncbi:hypothetical protein PENTCL1PPCAC_11410, partial [Pristionchus entomophagus]